MRKWTPKEVEQQLGMKYAQMLKESPVSASAPLSKECEEVIQGSLQLLERYNRVNMSMRSKGATGVFT